MLSPVRLLTPRLAYKSIIFVVDSVCLSVTMLLQFVSSFLFVDVIEPFLGRHFSMWHSTKLFFDF